MDYAAIAKEIVAEHTTYRRQDGTKYQSYDAVYFGQGFADTNEEVVSLYLAGDDRWREMAYDALDEWASDMTWADANTYRIAWEEKQPLRIPGYDESEMTQAIVDELQSVCDQDYCAEWVQNMRDPLVRFQIGDGDDPDFTENGDDLTPAMLLDKVNAEHTDENLKAAASIIANAYYPGCWRSLFGIIRLPLSSVGKGDTVRIKGGVMLWATNPYAGDGHAEEIEVDWTIDRSKLATDRGAPGYASDEVFGWYIPALPEPEVTFITTKEAAA
jgi:hypothetical protein